MRAQRKKDAIPSTVNSYVKDITKQCFHEYGYTRDDMVFTTPEEATKALERLIPVHILNPDNTAEKAQCTNDVTTAVYNGRIFGMGSQEKRLLNFSWLENSSFLNNGLKTRNRKHFDRKAFWEQLNIAKG
jgi:hypothetical protein